MLDRRSLGASLLFIEITPYNLQVRSNAAEPQQMIVIVSQLIG